MRLEVVEVEEGAQKSARRKAEAAQAVRAEDDPLALLRRRRDLLRGRQVDLYAVGAGQAPGLAKELHLVFMEKCHELDNAMGTRRCGDTTALRREAATAARGRR